MFKIKNPFVDSFFDDINGRKLDKYQRKVLEDDSDRLLVVAGAGSGKTLTIIGKVKYLIEKKGYQEEDILCLSFTNETVNNLKDKLNYNVDVLTFHKLALNILKEKEITYSIARDDLLNYLVDEYFYSFVNKRFLSIYFNEMAYPDILQDESFKYLKISLTSFIRKIKGNNISVNEIKNIRKEIVFDKDKIFLLFALEILILYKEELFGTMRIDFDDMINYASQIVESKGINKRYRYIIIDEYQDISKTRFNLINTILKKYPTKLMCVGDDYQAIYGFSGSNISLFLDFMTYFEKAKRIDIPKTYRNSYELVRLSHKFIMKNPLQLKKHLYATFLYSNPVVLVYYEDNYLEMFNNLLNYLYLEGEKNIMVLGRYNKDLIEVQDKHRKGVNIEYLTVHMSKGLECDNVILLKMQDDYLGFPSKVEDHFLIKKLNKSIHEIDYAEERRLFYVALTRTKKRIYILTPKKNPSVFISEIRKKTAILLLK